MVDQIRISGKNLGAVALNDFCPRCFWIKMKLSNQLPFQVFPGIFSSIDSFTKNIVHSWFDVKKTQPPWLNEFGSFTGYIEPPHFSKFNTLIEEYNIFLTGAPDGILVNNDKTYSIIDYKTAKYTGKQDLLFPMYEVQLNSYALIAERLHYPKISNLALIYAEPINQGAKSLLGEYYHDYGFAMGFSVHIEKVKIDPRLLHPLFERVRRIVDSVCAPKGIDCCPDCKKIDSLVSLIETQCNEG